MEPLCPTPLLMAQESLAPQELLTPLEAEAGPGSIERPSSPHADDRLLGMGRGHSPKFAKAYAQLGDAIVAATRRYVDEVQSGAFPAEEHSYKPNRETESGPRVSEQEREPARVVSIRH